MLFIWIACIGHPMFKLIPITGLMCAAACSSPSWPDDRFPSEVEVEQTLFSEGGGVIREACEAVVVQLTNASARRLTASIALRKDGWRSTPFMQDTGEHIFAIGATAGCNSGHVPPGDFEGTLNRPGAYYKLVNDG